MSSTEVIKTLRCHKGQVNVRAFCGGIISSLLFIDSTAVGSTSSGVHVI